MAAVRVNWAVATAGNNSTTVSYTYDVAGIRDSKTVGSTVYNYQTQNGKVARQTWGSHTLDIIYDNQGNPSCCIYDGTKYIYVLNLQGDVIRLISTTGSTVASYVYDAWGNIISSSGTMADINPIRYRGYYYDTETKLYYLQSRYYDPQVKRFVNADGYASTGQGFVGYNMFAYCNNNPVAYSDSDGTSITAALITVGGSAIISGVIEYANGGSAGDVATSAFWGGTITGLSLFTGFCWTPANSTGISKFIPGLISGVVGTVVGNIIGQDSNKKMDWGSLGLDVIYSLLVPTALEGIWSRFSSMNDSVQAMVNSGIDAIKSIYQSITNSPQEKNVGYIEKPHTSPNKSFLGNGYKYPNGMCGASHTGLCASTF